MPWHPEALETFLGAHSNSATHSCTSFNCWINSTEKLKRRENSCGINKHFKYFNCSALPAQNLHVSMSIQQRKYDTNEQTKQTLQRQKELACLSLVPVVWTSHWQSHLITNAVLLGAALSSATDLFFYTCGYVRNKKTNPEMFIFILILICLIYTPALSEITQSGRWEEVYDTEETMLLIYQRLKHFT